MVFLLTKNMSTLVSVVIVTHNREKLLPRAIDSVLEQDFSDFELIVIDDASSDNTEEVVKKYQNDGRFKYIKIKKANSISQARNSAWPCVNGKYVAVLDSDDVWCDNSKLAKQVDFLENNSDFVLVGSGAILINGRDEKIDEVKKPISDEEIKKDFLVKNPFFHSSVLYRYDDVKKIGGYDEKIRFGEDFDLWLRLGKEGKLYNFSDAFIEYRVHEDNEAKKHFGGAIFDVFKVIKKNRKGYGFGRGVFLKKIFGKFLEYFKRKN